MLLIFWYVKIETKSAVTYKIEERLSFPPNN